MKDKPHPSEKVKSKHKEVQEKLEAPEVSEKDSRAGKARGKPKSSPQGPSAKLLKLEDVQSIWKCQREFIEKLASEKKIELTRRLTAE